MAEIRGRLMLWISSVYYMIALFKEHVKNANLMNHDGLISTLDKVRWGIPSQGTPTIWDQVTILYREIIENHYFSDGNKRIGVLLAYIFLKKNGYEFAPPKGEIFSITMEVAQGSTSFEAIKEWFVKNSKEIL